MIVPIPGASHGPCNSGWCCRRSSCEETMLRNGLFAMECAAVW